MRRSVHPGSGGKEKGKFLPGSRERGLLGRMSLKQAGKRGMSE